jgi:hypothetical protein
MGSLVATILAYYGLVLSLIAGATVVALAVMILVFVREGR